MPRIQIAVEYVDGRREVVTIGRPADLIAFADEFQKVAPEEPHVVKEAAWLVHRALKIPEPLDVWVESLEGLERLDEAELAAATTPSSSSPEPAPDPTPAEPEPARQVGTIENEWPRMRAGRILRETSTASSSRA
jgi:hypothetical protein